MMSQSGVCVLTVCVWVCPGGRGVSVGDFGTSTQQLTLRTPLLRFTGETVSAVSLCCWLKAHCGRSLYLQVQDQPETGLWSWCSGGMWASFCTAWSLQLQS